MLRAITSKGIPHNQISDNIKYGADRSYTYHEDVYKRQDPTGYEMKYYCLSAYVEDGSDDPKNWIKLRPSTGVHREDTDNITVDDGTILIEVLPNTGSAPRSGIIYLTTIKDPNSNPSGSSMQRIKRCV